jgi:Tfp pilus assembly protein PilX
MKKNKIIVFALVILLIISAIFIGLNIRSVFEKERIRRNMINHVYSEFTTISF